MIKSQTRPFMTKLVRSIPLAVSLGFALAHSAAIASAPAPPPTPKTFYVSPSNVGVADGTSWTKAWSDVDKIDWSKVGPGDTIKLDGGERYATYKGTLTIGADGDYNRKIRIVVADEPGRNGQALITGGYDRLVSGWYNLPARSGIVVGDHKHISIEGRNGMFFGRPGKALRVSQFRASGVSTGPNSDFVSIKNVEIDRNGVGTTSALLRPSGEGLKLQGRNECESLIIHDNSVNVVIQTPRGGYAPRIQRSWIYNEVQSRIIGKFSDGVQILDSYRGGFSWYDFNQCVLGPGLSTGVVYSQKNSGLSINNCLFLNPRLSNLTGTVKGAEARYSIVSMRNVTSFLTPLNADRGAHACLDYEYQGQGSVENSIFYGGVVNVSNATHPLSSYFPNVQFATSGNTIALGPTQQDPRFVTNVTTIGAGDFTSLRSADFSLQPGSPASGKGSSVTSVDRLLQLQQQ